MKIALICPSNMLYMPYVGNYENILKKNKVEYDIINWDRFDIEDKINPCKYRDKKIGHKRNYFDYCMFKKFIVKILDSTKYDKVIVFGIQLSFFLKGILRKKYNMNYIIDIRDHNRIINYFNFGKIIRDSSFTVISSSGYLDWLPKENNYVINYNTQISSLSELASPHIILSKDKISIAYIGAIRDYKVNIDFITALNNDERINIKFHGEGDINKNIQDYLNFNLIKNVSLTGQYKKNEEALLYYNNDLINVLRYNDGINNKTALPNRLYNAAIYGKPMLAYAGTYLANQIEMYKLGIVVDSFDDIENKIYDYLYSFDTDIFIQNRNTFISRVITENIQFEEMLIKFIK